MSNQHIFKAQMFELYVKSILPNVEIVINTHNSDCLYFLIQGLQCWSSQWSYSDDSILEKEFSEIKGFDYISGKYNENENSIVHVYDRPECHTTIEEFAACIKEMMQTTDAITNGICEIEYAYESTHGYSFAFGPGCYVSVDPFKGVYIQIEEYDRRYPVRGILSKEDSIYSICTYEEFNNEKERYIGIIRSTIIKIKEFVSKHKCLINKRISELQEEANSLVKEYGL